MYSNCSSAGNTINNPVINHHFMAVVVTLLAGNHMNGTNFEYNRNREIFKPFHFLKHLKMYTGFFIALFTDLVAATPT